jgi:transcriptional regulator GlxA family with amidase domain
MKRTAAPIVANRALAQLLHDDARFVDQRIRITIKLMKGRLREELPVNDLARFVNLSPSRFHHLFKAETGSSPAHYLWAVRMELAKKLLETSFLGVKQIMNTVGLKDRSHFARDFKSVYGLTPTQCRSGSEYIGQSVISSLGRSRNRHKIAETAIE